MMPIEPHIHVAIMLGLEIVLSWQFLPNYQLTLEVPLPKADTATAS